MKVCVDIFPKKKMHWMNAYDFKEVQGRHGLYYTVKLDNEDAKKIIRVCRRKSIKFRTYEERWQRSSNYRSEFFKAYAPPYRCRYCRKFLKKEYMVIDHIVPVEQTKKNMNARMLLYIQGIDNVNHVRNLAPSCRKCNTKKGDKMGTWVLKGIMGKYPAYWAVRKAIWIMFFIGILIVLCQSMNFFESILSFL